LAERPFAALDQAAFTPARTLEHGTQKSEMRIHDGRPEVVTEGFGGKAEPYRVDRVIGHDPLRQFLVAAPGGRWQALETAYDLRKNEWFDVYGNEDRKPGEWGHWTGRGMNWNSMCASCHNTRPRKNYDEATDSFSTAMAERGVGCESCHGPMKTHVDWRRQQGSTAGPDPTPTKFTRDQVFDVCGSCHARRGELTGDFHPGEKFTDHFSLTVVDETDTYYADGQVRDEDYEFGSVCGSKMHAAGVRCIDCHQPHTAKTLLPGNALCMRCHGGGAPLPGITKPAPVIDPVVHSHHGGESAGAQCMSCHMPVTTYMQRHPRHDHGFTIPDPLLTQTLGIPNSCNRCHTDKDAAWSLAAVEKWYGEKMNRPTRRRAQAIAAARRGETAARDELLALVGDPATQLYWQATATHLLVRWLDAPRVVSALAQQTSHTSPIVRTAAIRALEPAIQQRPDVREKVARLVADSDHGVRAAAAWALRDSLPLDVPAMVELKQMLAHNADEPIGQMQLAAFSSARGDLAGALDHYRKAIEWDPNSPPIRHDYAVALSLARHTLEARAQLEECVRLDPNNAEYHYKLALAWNETGRTDQSLAELRRAVMLDPRHARAWYNLGLAEHAAGQDAAALVSLQRSEVAAPTDPDAPYATATILAQLGRIAEARVAAGRALAIRPGYAPAQELLRELDR
jgi:tetratricopeptide (TPR) repeat protein